MFIIGMIVGIVITLAIVIGYLAYCCISAGAKSIDDLKMLGEAGFEAFANRESDLEVWHEDRCLYVAKFKEE